MPQQWLPGGRGLRPDGAGPVATPKPLPDAPRPGLPGGAANRPIPPTPTRTQPMERPQPTPKPLPSGRPGRGLGRPGNLRPGMGLGRPGGLAPGGGRVGIPERPLPSVVGPRPGGRLPAPGMDQLARRKLLNAPNNAGTIAYRQVEQGGGGGGKSSPKGGGAKSGGAKK
jgi:hypothetical protein